MRDCWIRHRERECRKHQGDPDEMERRMMGNRRWESVIEAWVDF